MTETRVATETTAARGMSTFLVIWVGQVISIIGSSLTGFAMSVWVYQTTGSVTKFSVVILFTVLPGIVLSPVVGTIVDMWDRRWLMILSNVGAALSVLAVAALFYSNLLRFWHICFLAGATSLSNAVLSPALTASISLIVPKKHFGRASGMSQFGEATSQIIAPLLGGLLITIIKIEGILILDGVTYFVATVMLLLVRIPRPEAVRRATGDGVSFWRKAASGWTYLLARPGLFSLLVFFAMTNFALSMSNILITPLVLSFADAGVYATVISVAGAGLLAGSILMSVWGGPQRRIYGVFGYGLLLGLGLILEGLRPNPFLIGAALFIIGCIAPVANGCIIPILQTKTPPELQGRVFAAVRLVAWFSVPIAYIAAGPLADKVFNPLLVEGGALSGSVGQLIGVGAGRGIGLLLIVLGVMSLLATVRGYFYPLLLNVDTEMPDAILDKAAEGV
ncbi:MAG TPA: MFS transporter [Pyrinomonadaceae bacterium]|nr:MFS transporter [Pyrinomonadaceae bacterium]